MDVAHGRGHACPVDSAMEVEMRTFENRVEYAARCISEGRDTSCNRRFFNCFEEGDGDAVVSALVSMSDRSERLRTNIGRYLVVK